MAFVQANHDVLLLLTSVPDLRLDRLAVNVDRPCGELDADRRLGLEVELVACESREHLLDCQLTFA